MSVIIRLQNLPWSANALDIRQYFHGLSIPEGGVHIVGGEQGDAFIAFSTDEDARQAFQRNNGKIKEVQISLLLSSRTEMQKVIEAARNIQTPFLQQPAVVKPAVVPPVATVQPIQDAKKEESSSDSKNKDDKSKSSSKSRRRSRSRTRSRDRDRKDRSRDRSRDRRDRRRRDRSRSRDRRDKRRDRNRSKSRERTRSRDRDTRRSRDNKKRDRSVDRNEESNQSSHSATNDSAKPNPWERNNMPIMAQNQNPTPNPSLLGNYPNLSNTSLEDARRSLGLLTGIQNPGNMLPAQQNVMDLNSGVPRNNPMNRDWLMNSNAQNKPDPRTNSMLNTKPGLGALFQQMQQQQKMQQQQQQQQQMPMLGQQNDFGNNQRSMSMMFQGNMNRPRVPFNQEMSNMNYNNRPFMNRPGMPSMMPNRNSPDYTLKKDNHNDNYKRDYRNKNKEETHDEEEAESCVQLRPYWGGYGDLRRFFQGLYISNTGIKVVREANGRRNGVVYIKFVRAESRAIALDKSGMPLKGNNVDVTPISNAEFENYGFKNDEEEEEEPRVVKSRPFTCLVVEDIPSFAKEHDMLKMFSDYSLLGIDIQSINRRRHAYIQFNKEEDAEKALVETTKHILGGKQLVVRACPDKQLINSDLDKQNDADVQIVDDTIVIEDNHEDDLTIKDDMDISDPHDVDSASFETDVVLLSGMPPKTSDRDVIDFFSDIGLVPSKIHMILNKFGPTGECYCEFASPDEAIAALDKNGTPLGSGCVNVEPFPRKEMEQNLGMHPSTPPLMNPNSQMNQKQLQNRFAGRLGPRPMGQMGMPRPPLMGNMGNRMMGPRHYEGMNPSDPANMMPPGCVIAMENVPFKAGVDEILDFFRNFGVNHQSVLRRYNENGTPTGDARVTFNSPNEARRAFEDCKFKKIRDRTIFLRIM